MVDSPTSDAQTRDAETRRHDGRIAWSVAALIAGTVLIGVLVPGPAAHKAAGSLVDDAACAEWSDGCHVCQRTGESVACSLPGIACVPTELSCLPRVGG